MNDDVQICEALQGCSDVSTQQPNFYLQVKRQRTGFILDVALNLQREEHNVAFQGNEATTSS